MKGGKVKNSKQKAVSSREKAGRAGKDVRREI
jgi:hypothetical protein